MNTDGYTNAIVTLTAVPFRRFFSYLVYIPRPCGSGRRTVSRSELLHRTNVIFRFVLGGGHLRRLQTNRSASLPSRGGDGCFRASRAWARWPAKAIVSGWHPHLRELCSVSIPLFGVIALGRSGQRRRCCFGQGSFFLVDVMTGRDFSTFDCCGTFELSFHEWCGVLSSSCQREH